jgi:hypothetical protein
LNLPRVLGCAPPGHISVMGDNRGQSYDSRFWGPVPLEDVKGRAFEIYWSARLARRRGAAEREVDRAAAGEVRGPSRVLSAGGLGVSTSMTGGLAYDAPAATLDLTTLGLVPPFHLDGP